jgi:hypothetical protein
MTRASLLSSAALFATLAFVPNSGAAQWQSHDRINEPACSQRGNVDPRCFVAQLDESLDKSQQLEGRVSEYRIAIQEFESSRVGP